jgi:hypothetical protein
MDVDDPLSDPDQLELEPSPLEEPTLPPAGDFDSETDV